MSDYDRFKLGNVEFPVADSPFVGALEKLDPALYAALAFYKAVLVQHLGAYFDALATAAGLPDLVGKVVAEAVGYDPLPYLTAAQYKFPLLALYRTEEQIVDKTVAWYRSNQSWTLVYALPPLTAAQANQVVHVLKAVRAIILDRTEQGYDPSYLSGKEVWKDSGVAEIAVKTARYGAIPDLSAQIFFPALELQLSVAEQEDKTPGLDTFAGIDATIAVSNGTPAEDLDVAEIAWENVTP